MSVIVAHTGECQIDGLSLKWRQDDNLWTLRMSGVMRLGNGRAMFDSIIEFIDQRSEKLILDMGELRRVDSAGLGSLTMAAARLGERARCIRLNERMDSLLAVCKLHTVIRLSAGEEAARGELRASRR